MYVKRIRIDNYGPIERLDFTFPFADDRPKPVVLVGENGSGKSILLSHIVNGLITAQQTAYPHSPEVKAEYVYKLRSSLYIAPGKEFSFGRVDFADNLWTGELQLNRLKKEFDSPPDGISGTDEKNPWDRMPDTDSSVFWTEGFKKPYKLKTIFEKNCVLYFPPDRFEDPGWLNEANLRSKASHMNLSHLAGHTERKIINYSPLGDNQNWLFDLAYDLSVFEPQYAEGAKMLYDIVLQFVGLLMNHGGDLLTLGIGRRLNRIISVVSENQTLVPNIFQLSSGEVSLLNLFLSILRDYDLTGNQFTQTESISGIVVVDEIDLHLHVRHQCEILPKLLKMFPKIQFIVTSHSPSFVLGLKEVFGENGFGLYRLPEGQPLSPEEFSEFGEAYRLFANTQRHSNQMRAAVHEAQKTLIFVDGKTDVRYHTKAEKLLGFDDQLRDVEFRDGGGMLKKFWTGLVKDHVERKKVIVLHDPEEKVGDETRANVYRRKIEKIAGHPIQTGVENLFSKNTLNKAIEHQPAFIDITHTHQKTERGETVPVPETWSVNKDEKTNLCIWLCENGTPDDFQHFRPVFEMLCEILQETPNEPAQ